jgi:hypothetical protein
MTHTLYAYVNKWKKKIKTKQKTNQQKENNYMSMDC